MSYKKPLYGRATFKMRLKPFNYHESSSFYPNFCSEDKVRAYSVFGGIPYYLTHLNDNKSLRQNVIDLVIEENSLLNDEIEFFLKQELRSISTYGKIINAISSGATRLNKISTKAKISNTGTTSKFLNVLQKMDIIEKEICFGESVHSKKTIYRIKDNFIHFYYQFMLPHASGKQIMTAEDFYDYFVSPKLDEYVSGIFEEIAKEFLIRKNRDKKTQMFFEIGRYWYNNKEERKNMELDVVTRDDRGHTVFECKWRNRKFGHAEAARLKEISSVLSPYRLGGFSKAGFTDQARNDLDLTFTPDDLYH